MSYTLQEYEEVSRRWSVLKYLSTAVFFDRTEMVFAPEALDSSFYHVRWPMGVITNRPVVVFEYQSDQLMSKEAGRTGLRCQYQLQIAGGVFDATAGTATPTSLSPEILLDIWLVRLRKLQGVKIPFYDFRVPASAVRDAGYDFELRYLWARRESERNDRDKNVLTVGWEVKG